MNHPSNAPPVAPPALPIFWPLAAAFIEAGNSWTARYMHFLAEEEKLHFELRPSLASPNQPLLALRTMTFRDYSVAPAAGLPTIVDAPYAGHSTMIADYQPGQSLMETLRTHGVTRLYLTDWHSATEDMKDLEIDQYLAELNVCVDEIGGRVNLVGLCQGGWLCAMYAARFPHKVASVVLAGSPIDTDAGDGPIKRMAHAYPTSFYEELVRTGGGRTRIARRSGNTDESVRSVSPVSYGTCDHRPRIDIWIRHGTQCWLTHRRRSFRKLSVRPTKNSTKKGSP